MTETKTAPNALAVAPPAPKPPLLAGGKITAIVPQDLDATYRLANIIVKSGMAPKSLDTPEKATVAILYGLELGLTPMAALQSIAVVNGMPALYGDGLVALVRGSGLLEDMIETCEHDSTGPTIAVCKVKRRDQATWIQHAFTRPEAQRAGLWKKQGPWTQYPQRMLQMRARSWALRDAFADVLRGVRSAEELLDITAAGSATTAPPEPRRSDYVHSGEEAHDPETGEITREPDPAAAEYRPWQMPDGIAGQDARMKFIRAQFNDQAETPDEIDAIAAEHADFIAKLGTKRAAFEKGWRTAGPCSGRAVTVMTAAFQPLITDHLVLLWLSREEWTPRRELGPPDSVDELITRGYAMVMFHGRHGDAGGDGIQLTSLGWQEVARIQERLR